MMDRYGIFKFFFAFLFAGSILFSQTDTIPGYALQFYGGEYAGIADGGAFNFSGSFTIEAWIKVEFFSTNFQTVVSKGDGSWRIHRNFNTNVISFGTSGLSNGDLVGTTNVNDGQWHHIAAVYDGSQKLLYTDGNLDASTSVTGTLSTSAYNTAIGENLEYTGRGWRGNIDEVRIWNIARNADEIRSNIHRTLSGSETGLVSYYQFNDGSGTTVTDEQAAHDGAISGSPTWTGSTVALGYGSVNSATNFTNGTASLGNISMTMTDAFDNNVDVYAFEIPLLPNTYPSNASAYQGERYWIINTYGDEGTFSADLTFNYQAGELTETDSSKLILYSRQSGSDGTWNSTATGASSLTSTSVSFSGISSFSQFAISKNPFAGGEGSSGNPYQIATHTQLDAIRNLPSSNFILTQDIDLSFQTGNSAGDFYNGGLGWDPIANFTGDLDGDGHTISGLTINRPDGYGAFVGSLDGGEILNLGVINVNISGDWSAGGLVVENSGGTITNCYTTGSVSANSNVGGLVGSNDGDISNSYSQCNVTGNYAGGLAGDNSGMITTSYATGTVEGGTRLGGFVGAQYTDGNITYSYATGNVTASSGDQDKAGGFAGGNGGTISNCYARGNVTANSDVGGFSGRNGGTIENSYSIGLVSGSSTIGGFVGVVISEIGPGEINACFWDTAASGQNTSAGGTGKTTAEMKTQSTFADSGWNFSTVWEIVSGNYPRLMNNIDQALPVEIASFTATAKSSSIELKWSTATEVNNYGFEIQRSVRGSGFEVSGSNHETQTSNQAWSQVGFVQGHGTTNAPKEYSLTDKNLSTGTYSYRLKQIDHDGKFSYSQEVEIEIGNVPALFALQQNYPNPFNPTTEIRYQTSEVSMVTLKIYNMIGREVVTLVNGQQEAGYYTVKFSAGGGSASGRNASYLASGIYFARLSSNSKMQVRKMMLMK